MRSILYGKRKGYFIVGSIEVMFGSND